MGANSDGSGVRKSLAQAVDLGGFQPVTIDLSERWVQREVKLLNSTHPNLFDCATPSELCADNPWSPMALNPPQRLDAQALKDLAQAASPKSCQCALGPCSGWESVTEDRWPAPNLTAVGSLRADTRDGEHAQGGECQECSEHLAQAPRVPAQTGRHARVHHVGLARFVVTAQVGLRGDGETYFAGFAGLQGDALEAARLLCVSRGVRLTDLRLQVLELIWQNHKPLGAYTLM